MSRLLLLLALPLSLAVPAGAATWAIVAGTSAGDQQTLQMPVAPTPAPSASSSGTAALPKMETVQLFDGKSVQVSHICALDHDLDSKKQAAIAAARLLPGLKQRLLNADRDTTRTEARFRAARRPFDAFLRAHPEKDLAPAAYSRYQQLKARYEQARRAANARIDVYETRRKAYNAQVDRFDALADRFNTGLDACKS